MGRIRACYAAATVVIAVGAAFVPALGSAGTYEPVDWMPIDGSDLAHSQWVSGGDGSEGDPFVIEGWERNLTLGANGTELGSTVSYLTMRGNHFFGDGVGPHTQCCRALSVFELRNFTFEDNLVERVRVAYSLCCGYPDERVTQDNVKILRNQILNSTDAGLRFANARNFTIAENTFAGTGGPPISLQGNTADIRVYHNNFVDSAALPIDWAGSENAWDDGYPSGGNYWSDYAGVDQCKGAAQDDCSGPDGIGDTPYTIDSDSQDRYPLTARFTAPNHAPLAAFSASPSIPSVNETVTLDASQSVDPEDGAAGLQFRWDLDGDGAWDGDWAISATATTAFSTSGNHPVSVEVSDAHGAASNLTKTVVVVDPTIPDPHPAEVMASASAQVEVGAAVTVQAEVSDPEGVASVQVVYQAVGSSTFARAEMTHATGNVYKATLPAQTAAGVVQYFILVTDAQGHQTRDPVEGTHSLRVNPVTAVAGGDSLVFVLVGVAVAAAAVVLITRRRRA